MAEKNKLLILPGPGRRHPDAMLESAKHAGLEDVTVVGRLPSGDLWLSTSHADIRHVFWDLQCAADQCMEPE